MPITPHCTELVLPVDPKNGPALANLGVAPADANTATGVYWLKKRNRLVAVLEWHRRGDHEWAACGRLTFGNVADHPDRDTRVDPDTINDRTRVRIETMAIVQILARLADAAVAASVRSVPVPPPPSDEYAPALAVDADMYRYRDECPPTFLQMLADLALPEDLGEPCPSGDGQSRGTRRSADVSDGEYLASWRCRRVDGSTVYVRQGADGAWATTPADDVPSLARRVPADSLDLAVARALGAIPEALVPLRAALAPSAVAGEAHPLHPGARQALDRALAEVTCLRGAWEREAARRG